jgi:uncharacterized repeat protein (TIGR01451 family)
MKKIITAMTAMSLTLQANDSLNHEITNDNQPIQRNRFQELNTDDLLNEDLSFLASVSNEDNRGMGASGTFLDVDKFVSLDIDADLSGDVSSGDTLSYDIFIANPSQVNASGVFLDDAPDANTSLVVGSVTTTHGSLVQGGYPGDEVVAVDIMNLAMTETALVSFKVTVDPITDGEIRDLSNQALITSLNVGFYFSDDVNVPGLTNPTVIDAFGQSIVLYDEAVSGDLVDHFNIPNKLVLTRENQSLSGVVGGVGTDFEDCFQFDVTDSRVVNSIILDDFQQNGGSPSTAFKMFIGLPPIKPGIANFIDRTISEFDIGSNMLNYYSLTTGTYSICLIEQTPGQVYSFKFQSDVVNNIFNNGFE